MRNREVADNENHIKCTEYDLHKQSEKCAELGRVSNTVELELRQTSSAYDETSAQLCRGRAEQAQNENELATLKRAFELKMTDKSELVRRSDVEAGRYRDMNGLLIKVESNEAEVANNLMAEKRREEDLRLYNAGLCSMNYD